MILELNFVPMTLLWRRFLLTTCSRTVLIILQGGRTLSLPRFGRSLDDGLPLRTPLGTIPLNAWPTQCVMLHTLSPQRLFAGSNVFVALLQSA